MSRVRVYIATSLDGFIAGPDDDLTWLDAVAQREAGPRAADAVTFDGFLADVGAMLMGRRTYDVVAAFGDAWPYGDLAVLVPTHRALAPIRPTVRAVTGDIEALLQQARAQANGKDVYLDGGTLIRQALEVDAVDELIVTMAPVVLGGGVSLFAGLSRARSFEIVRHCDFDHGMVQYTLRPRRGADGSVSEDKAND